MTKGLGDDEIQIITDAIEFEIKKLDKLIESGLEEKFKYLIIGKIKGMMEVLRLFT